MKSTKTIGLTVVATILILLVLSFKSSDAHSETIMIRSTQIAFLGKNKSFIRIYKGSNQIEKIQLDKWDWEDEEKNFDKIMTTVNAYEKEGYTVVSHSEVLFGTNGFVNTFVMTKK